MILQGANLNLFVVVKLLLETVAQPLAPTRCKLFSVHSHGSTSFKSEC